MSLESFYGGKPGVSPVIKESFEYIDKEDKAYIAQKDSLGVLEDLTEGQQKRLEAFGLLPESSTFRWTENLLKPFTMDECFADVNYKDVWYDELCIIDTRNKLNPNNGKIFRRTLKRYRNPEDKVYSDTSALYAEYIGQIVGPSGGVPNIKFGSLDDIRKEAAGRQIINGRDVYQNVNNWDYLYPDSQTDGLTTTNANLSNRDGDNNRNNDYEQIAILNSGDNDNITIVPGKDEQNNFNDKVRYTWCNVRHNLNNSSEDSAWIYLGFEIPYTVWDVSATHIPYWLNTQNTGNIVDIQKLNDNDTDHPFYHNLHFYIPRGTRGIGPEEVILVKSQIENGNKINNHPKDNNNNKIPVYPINAISYDSTSDTYSLVQNAQSVTSLPDSYWIAKWTLYNPEQKNFEGSVTNTKFEENISSGDSTQYAEVWIYLGEYQEVTSIQYIDETGLIKVKYSNNIDRNNAWITVNENNEIDYIKNLRIDVNKTIIQNNEEINNPNYGKVYKISNIGQREDYTNTILPLIKEVFIDTDGHLKIKYANNNTDDAGLAKTTPMISPAVIIPGPKIPGSPQYYATIESVLDQLNQNGFSFGPEDNPSSITSNGTITVKGTDRTGGFIGAPVEDDQTIGLFYYDKAETGQWISIGYLGRGGVGSGGNSNIYFIENEISYPTSGATDIKIDFFVKNPTGSPNDIKLPEIWPEES